MRVREWARRLDGDTREYGKEREWRERREKKRGDAEERERPLTRESLAPIDSFYPLLSSLHYTLIHRLRDHTILEREGEAPRGKREDYGRERKRGSIGREED